MNWQSPLTLFFFFCFVIAKGQDSIKINTPPVYHINYSSTAIANNNSDNSSFVSNNSLKFNVSKNNIYINTANSWMYGSQTEGLTNNDFFSSLDFNLFSKPRKLYYWGLGTYEKSYSLKINDRFQGGLGAGYEVLNKKDFKLVISNGILYEESSLYDSPKYEVLRNSFRIKHKLVYKNLLTLEGTHFWQQALSSWNDYIIKSNTTLSVKIKNWLSLTAALNYNRLNINRKENLLFTVGLTFDKHF